MELAPERPSTSPDVAPCVAPIVAPTPDCDCQLLSTIGQMAVKRGRMGRLGRRSASDAPDRIRHRLSTPDSRCLHSGRPGFAKATPDELDFAAFASLTARRLRREPATFVSASRPRSLVQTGLRPQDKKPARWAGLLSCSRGDWSCTLLNDSAERLVRRVLSFSIPFSEKDL